MKQRGFEGRSLKINKIVFLLIAVLLLFISQVYVQKSLNRHPVDDVESFLYLPSGEYLKPLTLGYNQVVADLLWIKTVSYFGSHFMTDKEYPWLYHILTLLIDLDPRFDFPYYFGGVVLSLEASQFENANKILKRGIEAYPDKWEYPFYIGFNHYFNEGNPKKALPYIERAAALSGSPPFLKSLIGTLYLKTEGSDVALKFFREIYRNSQDEIFRKNISLKIEQILTEREEDANSH